MLAVFVHEGNFFPFLLLLPHELLLFRDQFVTFFRPVVVRVYVRLVFRGLPSGLRAFNRGFFKRFLPLFLEPLNLALEFILLLLHAHLPLQSRQSTGRFLGSLSEEVNAVSLFLSLAPLTGGQDAVLKGRALLSGAV